LERSRDAGSIVDEVVSLAEQGFKEVRPAGPPLALTPPGFARAPPRCACSSSISLLRRYRSCSRYRRRRRPQVTLLGQNVNSYHDAGTPEGPAYAGRGYVAAEGFSNMYRLRGGSGVRFTELLDRVSVAAPGVRVRFTSPHPKDFPPDLLALLAERPSLARQVHLPAQSGSTAVLTRMRRLYSREAYLALARRIRDAVPGIALSSDFIAGFCGETEADHAETLSLMREVRYENAFNFAYSRRALVASGTSSS
jgi:tRNA A37 methylthiotransferase MiaB